MINKESEYLPPNEIFFNDYKLQHSLNFVSESVERLNLKAILKGGAIRDMLCNHFYGTNLKTKDLDIFVDSKINLLHGDLLKNGAKLVERRTRKGSSVFKYQIPKFPEIDIEIGSIIAKPSQYCKNTDLKNMIKQDAFLTDLRVNSMSLPLAQGKSKWNLGEINDSEQGIKDIKERVLHVVNENELFPAGRILNTIRLSLDLDFGLPNATLKQLSRSCLKIKNVPYNLIQSEALKIINSKKYKEGIEVLQGIGLVDALFPGRIMEAEEIFKTWFNIIAPDFTIMMMKPDGVEKQLQSRIINELKEKGINVAIKRILSLTPEMVSKIYSDIRNEWLMPKIINHITSGKCEAFLLFGKDSLNITRKFIGKTALGKRKASGIRGKFADDFIKNIAHTPSSNNELVTLTKILFKELPIRDI